MQLRHLKIIYALFSFAIVVLATSCEPKQQEEVIDAPVKVARVFDSYLYMDDLQGVVQKNTPTNDSIDIVHSYINNWINKRVNTLIMMFLLASSSSLFSLTNSILSKDFTLTPVSSINLV
jgi:hypothetical protein